MVFNGDVIQRKAIHPFGRLGLFYDAVRDCFPNELSLLPSKPPISLRCHRSSVRAVIGDPAKTVYDYLRMFEVDAAIAQSILVGLVEPTGITSLAHYDQPIDERTVLLYFSYNDREEGWQYSSKKAPRIASVTSTHFITNIVRGFEVLCVLRCLIAEDAQRQADRLKRIVERSLRSSQDFQLSIEERQLIQALKNTVTYGSEQCITTSNLSLRKIIELIPKWRMESHYHHSIIYTMHSLDSFARNGDISPSTYPMVISEEESLRMEKKIQWINTQVHSIERRLVFCPNQNLEKYVFDLFRAFQRYRQNLSKILVRRRLGSTNQKFDGNLFEEEIKSCLDKIELIEELERSQIQYYDATTFIFPPILFQTIDDLDRTLTTHFTKANHVTFWHSTDRLRRERREEWNEQYEFLINQHRHFEQTIKIVYIDCTSLLCPLQASSIRAKTNSDSQSKGLLVVDNFLSYSAVTSSDQLSSTRTINVLFLGETGVGKSTFINAFVNYLVYETFEQAEHSETIALIPSSFITTVGHDFKEVQVNIGNPDLNEDFNDRGASVTQHCRSYIIPLRPDLHLRLIDTPGIGDTRGIEQDMKNIDHILSYVDQFSHLDAVCFLLKPNVSRMNIFFRSCLRQLFTYLTPQAYANISFCFTNTRSTFYAPGDTGPLLRRLLEEEHLTEISFAKENTFCFDSEAFRYLAARRQGVVFEKLEREEFVNSWTKSVTESARLLEFIEDRQAYNMKGWRSPKKLALEIRTLARPLLEQLRLMIYNLVLDEQGINDHRVLLRTSDLNSMLCSRCAEKIIEQVGPFFVCKYGPGRETDAIDCQCLDDEHCLAIESSIQHCYESRITATDVRKTIDDFRDTVDLFNQFIQEENTRQEKPNPFEQILEQFIADEQEIQSQMVTEAPFNEQVLQRLIELSEKEKKTKELKTEEIDRMIKEVMSSDDVKIHVQHINRSRQRRLKTCEQTIVLNRSRDSFAV